MNLFNQKPKRCLGIDFGTTTLRAVELAAGGSPKVLRHCSEPLPANLVMDRQIKDVDHTAEVLERMLAKSGIKTRHSTIAMAFSNVITKTFMVDSSVRENELEEMVETEAERTVTYPLAECSVDFYRSPAEDKQDRVRFVVCHRNGMQDQVQVLEAAGLEPLVVDVDAYSLGLLHSWKVKARAKPAEPKALLDLGHVSSRLIVIHNGEIQYTSDLPHGGRALLEAMQSHYELEGDQALAALAAGKLPGDFGNRVLGPFAEVLGNEIGQTLKVFYAGQPETPPINGLELIGGGARLPGIDQLLARRLEIAVRRIKALPSVDLTRRAKLRPEQLPEFTLAASLALRGVL